MFNIVNNYIIHLKIMKMESLFETLGRALNPKRKKSTIFYLAIDPIEGLMAVFTCYVDAVEFSKGGLK